MLESPITYIALLVATVYLTYKWFISDEHKSSPDKWYAYGRYLMPARFFHTFALFALIFSLGTAFGQDSDYAIAYTLLIVSILFISLSFAVFFSEKFNEWVWRFAWQKEPKTDRRWLAGMLLFLAAAFGFGFFLFYPPFISIG